MSIIDFDDVAKVTVTVKLLPEVVETFKNLERHEGRPVEEVIAGQLNIEAKMLRRIDHNKSEKLFKKLAEWHKQRVRYSLRLVQGGKSD